MIASMSTLAAFDMPYVISALIYAAGDMSHPPRWLCLTCSAAAASARTGTSRCLRRHPPAPCAYPQPKDTLQTPSRC